MRTLTILAALLLTIPSLEAQKQEIKKAEKAVNSGDLYSAKSYLQQAKRIFAAADDKTRAHYYVVEAELKFASKDIDQEKLESISKSLKLAHSYDPSSFASRISDIESKLTGLSSNAAMGEYKNKNYSEAATLYKVAFKATQDTVNLFNAARSHLLAKEYHDAFETYSKLYFMGFTDAKFRYATTEVPSQKKETYTEPEAVFTGINDILVSSSSRNQTVQSGTQKKKVKVAASTKVPDLMRGLTMAAIELNKKHEAITIIDQALVKYPNDEVLKNQAFHLYRELGVKNKVNTIMDAKINENPNDPNVYYNFAVSSAKSNNTEKAIELYKKTLALDPNHINAKINLSILLLDNENTIIEEMNSLGMSAAEDKRYEELKGERTKLYNEVLPYLESIVSSQPQNKDWVKKLMDIYRYIGQDSKMALLQEKIDE